MTSPENQPAQQATTQTKKPIYKRVWFWIVAVLALVTIVNMPNTSSDSKNVSSTSEQTATHESANLATSKREEFDLQSLVGQKWSDAEKTLQEKHWENSDYTVETDDKKSVGDSTNWTVTSVSKDNKPVIALHHDANNETKPNPTPETTQSETPTPIQTPEATPEQALAPAVAPADNTYYPNCDAVRAAGKAPLSSDQPGYRAALDRDHDGVACE